MSPGTKYKVTYLVVALLGVLVLGVLSPWLKTHGSTIYVISSFGYLFLLILVARSVAARVSKEKTSGQIF